MTCWIFQGKPSRYDVEKEFVEGKVEEWTAYQNSSKMKPGEIVFFWRAAEREREKRGIYGWGKIIAVPKEDDEYGCWVPVIYKKRFPKFIPFDELKKNRAFSTHQIFTFAIGTNFMLTEKQCAGLKEVIKDYLGEQYLPAEDA